MSRDVPNPNAMGAYAAAGGAIFLAGAATAIGEGIKAAAWAHRENQILKENTRRIAEMDRNCDILEAQVNDLLNRMLVNHEKYPPLTQLMSEELVLKYALQIPDTLERYHYDGFELVRQLRALGLAMVESEKELNLYADEELNMLIEEDEQ
ncbi:hypothetical protein [Brucella gallinifaecis]|uniref:hypothetical protein n=1 Tax=Brucella gallinifaecis TaxID=215590 RepID=UPI00235F1C7F|nr:hypothetical protein [Brucella gallinifaecis]